MVPRFFCPLRLPLLLRFVKRKIGRRGRKEPEEKAKSGMLIVVVGALSAGLDGKGQVIPLRR